MKKISCKAFGKINLTLDVLGKRADGYHEVRTIYQGISLFDLVEIEKIEKRSGKEREITLTCNRPELSTGADNLAYRAARLLQEDFPRLSGFKIHLTKRIPLAAGLAGGSADAAAVLLGINELEGLGLSPAELRNYGALLGSDVPFCLEPLTALGEGRGELLQACAEAPEMWLTLFKPPFSVSTKEVYENLTRVNTIKRPDTEKVLAGLEKQDQELILAHLANVLEESTFNLFPQLGKWKTELEELGACKVMMAGSGPTLLAFAANRQEAEQLAASFSKQDWEVVVVRTTNREDLAGRMVLA